MSNGSKLSVEEATVFTWLQVKRQQRNGVKWLILSATDFDDILYGRFFCDRTLREARAEFLSGVRAKQAARILEEEKERQQNIQGGI